MSTTAEGSIITDSPKDMNKDATLLDKLKRLAVSASSEDLDMSSSLEATATSSPTNDKPLPLMKLEPTFLSLPREIRDLIFDYVHDNELIVWCTSNSPRGINFNRIIKGKRRHQIMAVNRQLHDEFARRPMRAYVRTNHYGITSAIRLPPFKPAPIIKKIWLQISLLTEDGGHARRQDLLERYYKSRTWQTSESLVAWAPELEWLRIEVTGEPLKERGMFGVHKELLKRLIPSLMHLHPKLLKVNLMLHGVSLTFRQGSWGGLWSDDAVEDGVQV